MQRPKLFSLMTMFLLVSGVSLSIGTLAAQETNRIEPVAIRMQRSLIDAPVELIEVIAGTVQEPTGLWTVGWIQESAPLGQPGNAVYFGFKEFRDAGPGVFWFLDQTQPGHRVLVTGSDGLVYRYEVFQVETFPMETAVQEVFADVPEGEHWLTFFTSANYDVALNDYTGILVVRAAWSPEDEPKPAAQETAIATGLALCPGVELLPQQVLYASVQSLGMPKASLTSTATINEIDQSLLAMPGCEFTVREALTLPDGNVLALLGPSGAVPVSVLTGAVDAGLGTVTDQQRVSLFEYALFVNEGGIWNIYAPPLL